MSSYEAGIGQELGEAELGELEVGEYGELGEGELTELGEGEYGELGEGELAELGEWEGESQEAQEQLLGEILGALPGEAGSGLTEAQEVELAAELLGVTSEAELEQFLGKLFKRVVRGVGSFVRSPIGRAVGGVLKGIAKKALPVVGGALGSMVAPGIGTAIGTKLGSLASGLFELETEAMSGEQAEFEVARRYVRLAASTARHAAAARPAAPVNPRTVARAAVARAARQVAPAIYRAMVRSLRGGGFVPRRAGYGGRPTYAPPPFRPPGAPPAYVPAVVRPSLVAPAPAYAPASGWDAGAGWAPAAPGVAAGPAMSGRWIRRGRRILLLGV